MIYEQLAYENEERDLEITKEYEEKLKSCRCLLYEKELIIKNFKEIIDNSAPKNEDSNFDAFCYNKHVN